MKTWEVAVLLALPALAAAAGAKDGKALAEQHGCLGCHALVQPGAAPAFHQVAVRYKQVKNARAHLVATVKQGSSGVWGEAEMPPQEIPEPDLKVVVDWVLRQ